MAEAPGRERRLDLVEGFPLDRLARAPEPEPAPLGAWALLAGDPGGLRIAELARPICGSRGRLAAGFRAARGLSPEARRSASSAS